MTLNLFLEQFCFSKMCFSEIKDKLLLFIPKGKEETSLDQN